MVCSTVVVMRVVSTGPTSSLHSPPTLFSPIVSRPPYGTVQKHDQIDEVMAAAKRAKEAGSTRFCMGAAWRELGNKKKAFNNILDMVSNKALL